MTKITDPKISVERRLALVSNFEELIHLEKQYIAIRAREEAHIHKDINHSKQKIKVLRGIIEGRYNLETYEKWKSQ